MIKYTLTFFDYCEDITPPGLTNPTLFYRFPPTHSLFLSNEPGAHAILSIHLYYVFRRRSWGKLRNALKVGGSSKEMS